MIPGTVAIPFDRRNPSHVTALRAFCRAVLAEVDVDREPVGALVGVEALGQGQGDGLPVHEIRQVQARTVLDLSIPLECLESFHQLSGQTDPEDDGGEPLGDETQLATRAGNPVADVDKRTVGQCLQEIYQGVAHSESPVSEGTATIPHAEAGR